MSTSFPRQRHAPECLSRGREFRLILVLLLLLAPALALAQYTEWRTAYMDCGKTQVRALAECYENTGLCISETLSFARSGRRTIVGMHQHFETYDLHKRKVKVLDYHASSWACLTGKDGGRYLSVVMDHSGACSDCTFVQLYDPNGRLVAASVKFDAHGKPRENAEGTSLMRRLTGPPAPRAFASIYKPR